MSADVYRRTVQVDGPSWLEIVVAGDPSAVLVNVWSHVEADWPRFHLFPRLERARIGACVARTRVLMAWRVLRGRETTQSEWEDE